MKSFSDLMKGYDRLSYFIRNFILYYLPDNFSNAVYLPSYDRFDKGQREEIEHRSSYYVRLPSSDFSIGDGGFTIDKFRYPFGEEKKHTTYFFDLFPFLRSWPADFEFNYVAGDVDFELPVPAFVKSRPVTHQPTNNVICRLNSIRHFRFVNDKIPFRSKQNRVLFRNVVRQPWRVDLMARYFNHPKCDFGQTNNDGVILDWIKPYMPIEQQLHYKFIMCVRGNDVATNLKWVMSSNSLAVMPRPTVESWFMEGLLQPDIHYVEIKDDYSDLIEKTDYYAAHPNEAEKIINNAHAWVNRFRNIKLEYATMRRVVEKYFEQTGQL